jgi:hypothetical protein
VALISVCDKCQEREGVETYTLDGGGRRARVDLCVTHARLAMDLMDLAGIDAKPTPRKRTARKRTAAAAAPRVVTMGQIEEMKKSD